MKKISRDTFTRMLLKKMVIALFLVLAFQCSEAVINVRVCESDTITPFDNRDITVGTDLTFIVSSDVDEYWSGGFFIAGQDRGLGTLAGRDYDPNSRDYTGSHSPEAGGLAKVTAWQDSNIWGFDLYGGFDPYGSAPNCQAGDWFVIDYHVDQPGSCDIGFYDYDMSWSEPNFSYTFTQVPTRDFNDDQIVNLLDFAVLSSYWLATDCNDCNWCDETDIDTDGDVDVDDLVLFTDYWLDGAPEPNEPEPEPESYIPDPNTIYIIIDANDFSEITIGVNESVTLYVDMNNIGINDIQVFDIEVNISDPNLGFIDNMECPDGTAEILANPTVSFADYWGPGIEQVEGIKFSAIALDTAINDGYLASFVYTSDGEGDVTLKLLNIYSSNTNGEIVHPTLEEIVIHQVDQEMMMGGESAQTSQTEQGLSADEMLALLQDIWLQEEELWEIYTQKEWDKFIKSVEDALDEAANPK